jgi:Tfp pilus assembly protein PilZ
MQKQRGYQRFPRYTKRLEVTFSSGNLSYKGILSNISENGIFIRTNRGFAPGTTVDIEVMMPDQKISHLKGIVKRTVKTPLTAVKNGMGVELTQQDQAFLNFVRSYGEGQKTEPAPEKEKSIPPEFQIIICSACGVKNKVLTNKLSLGPKCGKCGKSLTVIML